MNSKAPTSKATSYAWKWRVVGLAMLSGCAAPDTGTDTITAPTWPEIKSRTQLNVALPEEFGTPYLQSHATLGWEDGVFISRDGLHMYAFYVPADLTQFLAYLRLNRFCPDVIPFLRGPRLSVDTQTNSWGCSSFLQSDIVYASRANTADPFGEWRHAALSVPVEWDGAPQAIYKDDGSIDIFIYSRSTSSTTMNGTDLFWIRDTNDNPQEDAKALPTPVNSKGNEDNPHIERLDKDKLVLFFDNHAGNTDGNTDIFYTLSNDDGTTWQAPALVNDIDTEGVDELQAHLWYDGTAWWLYFVSENENSALSIYRAKQRIPGDFNSWGTRELVISPGTVPGTTASVIAVGEPTLTAWGDISFVVVYYNPNSNNPNDQYDIDPWYLPRKNPVTSPAR